MTTTPSGADLSARPVGVSRTIRNRINRAIQKLGNYFETGIPLDTLFAICEEHGLVPIQEDGCKWSGFLCGGHECGSDEARNQVALLPLADNRFHAGYRLTTVALSISWGTLYRPNGTRRWEVVAYVN